MTPLEIQIALKKAGFLQADIARQCDVKPPLVHDVVYGQRRSKKVEMCLAAAIGKRLIDIWPDRYGPNASRSRQRFSAAERAERLKRLAELASEFQIARAG